MGPDSVMEGKHSEAIREGVQDYELLRMLREKVKRVRKSGGDGSWVIQSEKLLSEGVSNVLQSVTATNLPWSVAKDRSLMDALRILVMDALEQAPQD